MENLKLNETPVRTARNYNINNIKLQNIELPKKSEFKNIEIINDSSILEDNVEQKPLVFGTGKVLEEHIAKNVNHKLKITSNKKKETVKIFYTFDEENLNLSNQIEIMAEGELNVIIKYESKTNKPCFHNGIIRVMAKENAKVNIAIINLLNSNSNHFEAMENELEENSKLKYTVIDLGAKNSITNYYANMVGDQSKNDLKSIYLGSENQTIDINYIVELRGKKTKATMDTQGALQDNAKKNYKGTIDFKKGAKKSIGSENEYCMLLSDKAKSLALPMLLCTEDDVEGSHSTASGKAEPERLFYLMSRGISYKEAIKLMVKARFNKIIERIKDEELEKEILNEIDGRLD